MQAKNNQGVNKKKRVFLILLFLAMAILFVQLFVMFYVDPKAESYIIRKVGERSRGQYTLRFENISINIFNQSISAQSVYLTPIPLPDTVKRFRKDELEIFIPKISAQGLDLWSALWNREIVVSEIKLESPRIKLKRNSKTNSNPSQYRRHLNYYRLLKGIFNAALVKNITINEGYLELYRLLDRYDHVATVRNIDLNLKNVLLDSTVTGKEHGYLDIGGIEAKLSSYSQRSPDSTYLLSVGAMDISSSKSYFHVKDINLLPLESPEKKDLRHNIIYEVYVPEFNLDNIDLKQLYKTRQLKLESVKVTSPAIKAMGYNVSRNRHDSIEEVNFYPLISEYLQKLHIEKVLLENTKLDIVNTKENLRTNLEKADIFLYDFKMGPQQMEKKDRLFYSDKVFIKTNAADPMLLDSLDFSKQFIKQLNQ